MGSTSSGVDIAGEHIFYRASSLGDCMLSAGNIDPVSAGRKADCAEGACYIDARVEIEVRCDFPLEPPID
jgi:hypothetical protein